MFLKAIFGRMKKKPAPEPEPVEPKPEVPDGRRAPRQRVMRRTNIYVARRPMRSVIIDVSESGARIAAHFSRQKGEVVGLALEVNGRTMVLPMQLAWDRHTESGWEYGGRFVDLTPEEQSHLAAYVEQNNDREEGWEDVTAGALLPGRDEKLTS